MSGLPEIQLTIDFFTLLISSIFPLDNLAPLCAFRHPQQLIIVGMKRSYQRYIWLVVNESTALAKYDPAVKYHGPENIRAAIFMGTGLSARLCVMVK